MVPLNKSGYKDSLLHLPDDPNNGCKGDYYKECDKTFFRKPVISN